MTNETPAKVMSLLGAALASLAFLFVVTVSDASFAGTYVALPDPFSTSNVVAMLDTASNTYSNFVQQALLEPTEQSYAVAADNIAWIGSQDTDAIKQMLGLEDYTPPPIMVARTRVAGASTQRTVTTTATGFTVNVTDSTPSQ